VREEKQKSSPGTNERKSSRADPERSLKAVTVKELRGSDWGEECKEVIEPKF